MESILEPNMPQDGESCDEDFNNEDDSLFDLVTVKEINNNNEFFCTDNTIVVISDEEDLANDTKYVRIYVNDIYIIQLGDNYLNMDVIK